MVSDKLALAIPTFNRPDILLQNLRTMLPELREHAIPIYISDDSTTDETQRAVEILQSEYPHIHYTRNQPGLGHDRNCLATLALPNAQYTWYLGDSVIIRPGVLAEVLAIAENDYDFIFMNFRVTGADHITVIPRSGITAFFERNAWHLAKTGATIYSLQFQHWMCANAEPRMYRNFQQLGMIFEYVYGSPDAFARAYWFNRKALSHNKRKQSYWMNSTLQVFAQDWVALVDAFADAMGAKTCETIIRSHGVRSGIFSLKNLIELRSRNLLNPATLHEYGRYLTRACAVPPILIRLLAHLPRGLAVAFTTIRRGIRELPRRLVGR